MKPVMKKVQRRREFIVDTALFSGRVVGIWGVCDNANYYRQCVVII